MDIDTLDITDVEDHSEYPLEDEYEIIEELDEGLEPEVVDYSQTMLNINKEKITIPYLTKYEKTRLLGVRTQQLSMGAIPMVEVGNLKDTADIAEKELRERKIPLIIRR